MPQRKGARHGIFSTDIRSMDDSGTSTTPRQIEDSLPDMIEKASPGSLRDGFVKHLEETRGHVQRLERVFELQGKTPKGVTCAAIDGILRESAKIAGEVDDEEVLDGRSRAGGRALRDHPPRLADRLGARARLRRMRGPLRADPRRWHCTPSSDRPIGRSTPPCGGQVPANGP